jgi:hypothetical protein
MAVTRLISWNGFSEITLWSAKEKGMDRSVEAGHMTFVRCRIATAIALMRCRLDKKNAEHCKLVPTKKSDVFVTSVMVYDMPPSKQGHLEIEESGMIPTNTKYHKTKARGP